MKYGSLSKISMAVIMLLVSGCGGNKDDPPEEINKLRALGVSASKLTASPSASLPLDTITLAVTAAAPKGTLISIKTFVDEGFATAVPVETTLVPGSEAYDTSFESIDLYSATVLLAIPPATAFKFRPGVRFISLRYGIELTAGAESERIVGSLPIYQPGSPEIDSWKPLTIDIVKPLPGATLADESKESLEGSITKVTEENVRVGWFVTGGTVKNRRAKETSWETPTTKGKHALIFTARGLNTGSFALKTIQVDVN